MKSKLVKSLLGAGAVSLLGLVLWINANPTSNDIAQTLPVELSPPNTTENIAIAESKNAAHLHKEIAADRSAKVNVPTGKAKEEIERLVIKEQKNYDALFSKYKNAVADYEKMSNDLDVKIEEKADKTELITLAKNIKAQAKEMMSLEHAANAAYDKLMAKYDEVTPKVMAKHF